MIVDTNGDGMITKEEKIEALQVMASDNNFLQNILNEYFMSNTDRVGEQLVICAQMLEH